MAEDRCRWKETQSRVRVHTCGHSLLHRSHGEKRLANLRLKFIKFILIGIFLRRNSHYRIWTERSARVENDPILFCQLRQRRLP